LPFGCRTWTWIGPPCGGLMTGRNIARKDLALDAVPREHRQKLLETRLALGLGKPNADTLLFGEVDGSPRRPDQLSWLWRSACKSLKLPMVSFHALRHTPLAVFGALKRRPSRVSSRDLSMRPMPRR
jgi:integrase